MAPSGWRPGESVSDARSTLYQDLFGLDDLLTQEEREVSERVRAFSDAEVIPIMADCWERGEFPFQLVPKLAASVSVVTPSRDTGARVSAQSGRGSRPWSWRGATEASTRSSGRLPASL